MIMDFKDMLKGFAACMVVAVLVVAFMFYLSTHWF